MNRISNNLKFLFRGAYSRHINFIIRRRIKAAFPYNLFRIAPRINHNISNFRSFFVFNIHFEIASTITTVMINTSSLQISQHFALIKGPLNPSCEFAKAVLSLTRTTASIWHFRKAFLHTNIWIRIFRLNIFS